MSPACAFPEERSPEYMKKRERERNKGLTVERFQNVSKWLNSGKFRTSKTKCNILLGPNYPNVCHLKQS